MEDQIQTDMHYLTRTKRWITGCRWTFEPKIHWHVLFSFFPLVLFVPSLPHLTVPLPPVSLASCLPSTVIFHHPPAPSSISTPLSSALSCVSLHAWLAAVIPVLPSVIRGQCRNRCITGRNLTTQHFTGQALYRLSSLTAQCKKKHNKNRRRRQGCGLRVYVWSEIGRERHHTHIELFIPHTLYFFGQLKGPFSASYGFVLIAKFPDTRYSLYLRQLLENARGVSEESLKGQGVLRGLMTAIVHLIIKRSPTDEWMRFMKY